MAKSKLCPHFSAAATQQRLAEAKLRRKNLQWLPRWHRMPLVVRPCRGGPELASGGDEVRANYEVITRRLPKLDESRTERFEREAQPFRAAALRLHLASAHEREHSPASREVRREVQGVDDIDEPIGDEYADDFTVPMQVADAMDAVIAGCRRRPPHARLLSDVRPFG